MRDVPPQEIILQPIDSVDVRSANSGSSPEGSFNDSNPSQLTPDGSMRTFKRIPNREHLIDSACLSAIDINSPFAGSLHNSPSNQNRPWSRPHSLRDPQSSHGKMSASSRSSLGGDSINSIPLSEPSQDGEASNISVGP